MYLNKILVLTDFSDESKESFGIALQEAKTSKSEITLIHVIERHPIVMGFDGYVATPDLIEKVEKEQQRKADSELAKIAKENFTGFQIKTIAVKTGLDSTAHTICRYAKDNHFGLIVVSSRGMGAVGRFFLGSTTERIVRLSDIPVLITRATKKSDISATAPTGLYNQIIVATDFSTDSMNALKYAAYESKLHNAKVAIVHVVREPFAPLLFLEEGCLIDVNVEKIQKDYLDGLAQKLVTYAKDYFPLAEVETKLLEKESSSTGSTITNFSQNTNCDLIVISKHGVGLGVQLLGGVVEKVIREAGCPVLVIPRMR